MAGSLAQLWLCYCPLRLDLAWAMVDLSGWMLLVHWWHCATGTQQRWRQMQSALPIHNHPPLCPPCCPRADIVSLVKRAVRQRGHQQLAGLLDAAAGPWPIEQAAGLADLAVRCMEYERSERASLSAEVLPELQALLAQAREAAAT